jgi:hypothetical protein
MLYEFHRQTAACADSARRKLLGHSHQYRVCYETADFLFSDVVLRYVFFTAMG